jgi:hypothetical protein
MPEMQYDSVGWKNVKLYIHGIRMTGCSRSREPSLQHQIALFWQEMQVKQQ